MKRSYTEVTAKSDSGADARYNYWSDLIQIHVNYCSMDCWVTGNSPKPRNYPPAKGSRIEEGFFSATYTIHVTRTVVSRFTYPLKCFSLFKNLTWKRLAIYANG